MGKTADWIGREVVAPVMRWLMANVIEPVMRLWGRITRKG